MHSKIKKSVIEGLQPIKTQTCLLSCMSKYESWNFRYRKYLSRWSGWLICTFVVCIGLKQILLWYGSYMDRVKWIWYLSPVRAAKVQASLHIHAVLPEPSLLAHTSSESRRTFRQKARSLAPLNSWACAVKICHDGILEDTDSLDAAHIIGIIMCHGGFQNWEALRAVGIKKK